MPLPLPEPVIVAAPGTWVVRAGGAVIGESDRAVELVRPDAPGLVFFPRDDLGMAFLEPTDRVRDTSGLGEARYYDIIASGGVITDAAWSYETPSAGAERLAGLIAFDPRRVAVEEL